MAAIAAAAPSASLSPSLSTEVDRHPHFRIADIQLIAQKAIGLRHVSSRKAALSEKGKGVNCGCSFNLTFQKNTFDPHDSGTFDQLPNDLSQGLPEEEKLKRVLAYEQAVTKHLEDSYGYDLLGKIELGKTTVGEVCSLVENCCLFLIDYSSRGICPKDYSSYNGLGRFAAQWIKPSEVKVSLPFFDAAKIGRTDLSEVIESDSQYKQLKDQIITWFRSELLQALRTNHGQFQDRLILDPSLQSIFEQAWKRKT